MKEMIERFLYYNKKRENISFRQKYITAAKVDDTLTYFFYGCENKKMNKGFIILLLETL